MSRLGKIPVTLPKDVKVAIEPRSVLVTGPKGKISVPVPQNIKVEQKDDKLMINRLNDAKQTKANHGTVRAHLVNMIKGVTQGHKIDLEVQGVGFRGAVQGQKLTLNVGFSHQVEYDIPNGIKVVTPKPTEISIEGLDIALVGEVAANIRGLKPPEPYKGKGIRYAGEAVRRKQGKSVTK
jgi:large subunit ribosomal protein L6